MDNFRYIITGGPGSGKTSLVEALQEMGYTGFPEIARKLIEEGFPAPIRATRADSGRFFDQILNNRISSHQAIKGSEIAFYDRGIPDSAAYFRFQNLKVPDILSASIEKYRYNPVVFAAPPWEMIYSNDEVRRETFSECVKLFELTVEEYRGFGYSIIELPKAPLERRIAEVLSFTGQTPFTEPRNDR